MSEPQFDRGSALSVFSSDRLEDVGALVCAFLIAMGILYFAG